MPVKKAVKVKPEANIPGFYKGYDIKWLKDQPDHPEYKLVAEYEAKEKKG